MLIDRNILITPYLSDKKHMNLICGACSQGRLAQAGIINGKTAAFKSWEKEEHYDGRGYDMRVCRMLTCNNSNCGETYLVVGQQFEDYEWEYDPRTGTGEQIDVILFRPLFFYPALFIFNLHKVIPNIISDELLKSFNLFFADFAAAANKIRISLELLMTELGVINIDSKGKVIDLHSRLELFKKQNAILGEQLLSIKLVGNSGSHPLDIEREDVVMAYEIIEHVLDELYVLEYRRNEAIAKAKIIDAKKGKLKSLISPKQSLIPLPPPSA